MARAEGSPNSRNSESNKDVGGYFASMQGVGMCNQKSCQLDFPDYTWMVYVSVGTMVLVAVANWYSLGHCRCSMRMGIHLKDNILLALRKEASRSI